MLREKSGMDEIPNQWATAGYMGAIMSGRTICGVLYGASIFLGYRCGEAQGGTPELENEGRKKAIASVLKLFTGFSEKFGETDCQKLTGCDWSKKEDIKRYYKEEVYKDTCFRQFEYVLDFCLGPGSEGRE